MYYVHLICYLVLQYLQDLTKYTHFDISNHIITCNISCDHIFHHSHFSTTNYAVKEQIPWWNLIGQVNIAHRAALWFQNCILEEYRQYNLNNYRRSLKSDICNENWLRNLWWEIPQSKLWICTQTGEGVENHCAIKHCYQRFILW